MTNATGTFFAPVAFEIEGIGLLEREVFGPILHVVRYRAADLDRMIGGGLITLERAHVILYRAGDGSTRAQG